MNKYLPTKEELIPITNKYATFYNCGFNKEFDELEFKHQLQVVNDLVRQSMLPNENPCPATEVETLIGNCTTAALATIDYLKYLKVGYNHRMVLCKGRPYDPEDITSRHNAVLVDDKEGNTYFVDSTPYVGYMFGKVVNLKDFMPYREFHVIDGEKFKLFTQMRNIIYKGSNNLLKPKDINDSISTVVKSMRYPFLNGHSAQCIYYLSRFATNYKVKENMLRKSIEIDPYESLSGREIRKSKTRRVLIEAQITNWEKSLADLRQNKEIDKQVEFETARYIFQEKKLLDDSLETRVDVGAKHNRISNFTPRLFLENGLNVVFIKPSAYKANVDEIIRNKMVNSDEIVWSYKQNLALPREITGLHSMELAHPVGKDFERAMYGPSEIILVRHSSFDLRKRKKELRAQLATDLYNKTVEWFDGKDMLWDPDMLNLVHSTDDPCEACLHFTIGQPEQQLMTRFMYPNPILGEVEKRLFENCQDWDMSLEARKEKIDCILNEIHPSNTEHNVKQL